MVKIRVEVAAIAQLDKLHYGLQRNLLINQKKSIRIVKKEKKEVKKVLSIIGTDNIIRKEKKVLLLRFGRIGRRLQWKIEKQRSGRNWNATR